MRSATQDLSEETIREFKEAFALFVRWADPWGGGGRVALCFCLVCAPPPPPLQTRGRPVGRLLFVARGGSRVPAGPVLAGLRGSRLLLAARQYVADGTQVDRRLPHQQRGCGASHATASATKVMGELQLWPRFFLGIFTRVAAEWLSLGCCAAGSCVFAVVVTLSQQGDIAGFWGASSEGLGAVCVLCAHPRLISILTFFPVC